MAEHDFLDDRRKASEDDYFRKQDRALIEKLRAAAEADRAMSELRASTGLSDPDLIRELQALGFTPDTIAVLPLVPLLQVAWAEGGITPEERALVVTLARRRGIAEGSPADVQLSTWLAYKPAPDVFTRATRLIRAMLDTGHAPDTPTADDLIQYSENIAAASGGILGIGRISAEERKTLDEIVATLKARK